MSRRGLTLVEVLVVVAIAGVAMALAIPVIVKSRAASDRAGCAYNLKNQAVAVLAFEASMSRLPPGSIGGPFPPHGVPDGACHGLHPCLMAFLGTTGAANRYRFDVNYADATNQAVARMRMGVLICPGVGGTDEVFEVDDNGNAVLWGASSNYGAVQPSAAMIDQGWSADGTRIVGALPANGVVRMSHVKDGASATVLLAEQGRRGPAWVSPATLAGPRDVFPGGAPGGAPHGAGFHAAFCDGTVRFLAFTMDPRVFAAMCTANGGEPMAPETRQSASAPAGGG
jgi:prepilin-type N-terminal cleavage/methylation domain-containing protein